MHLDRRSRASLLAALILAGCSAGPDSTPERTGALDYVSMVRPLAYDNAHAACSGHSLTSLAYEFGVSGSTIPAAARNWVRRNQRDVRVRDAAYRGCRDALWQAAGAASR
jgi:hypothetical protein